MTAAALEVERRELQRIAYEAEEKLLRRKKWLYLLNRSGGLEARLDHREGDKHWMGKFEALSWPVPLSSVKDIENIDIRYQLVLDGRQDDFQHILEGKLSSTGGPGEEIVLRLVSGGVNPIFDRFTITLSTPAIEEKMCSGEWSAHIPPTAAEKSDANLLRAFEFLMTGKTRLSGPKGTDFSGPITLRAVSYSKDDALLELRPAISPTVSQRADSPSPTSLAPSSASRMAVVDDPEGTTILRENGPNSPVVGAVPSKEVVEVLQERADGWLRVRRSTGPTGYVDGKKMKARDETAHARIRAFVAEHHAKASRRDVNAYTEDYDTEVDFLDEGKRTRERLAKDWRKYFGDTEELDERVVTTPEVTQVRYGYYVVRYQLVSKRKKIGVAGVVEVMVGVEMNVRMSDAPPVITFQRQKRN